MTVHVVVLGIFAALLFWPIGVDYSDFGKAEPSLASEAAILAGRADRLDNYAVSWILYPPGRDRALFTRRSYGNLETRILVFFRSKLFYGKDTLVLFALEHAPVWEQIVGIRDAAEKCFQKPASELTLSDSATIVMHIRAPWREWEDDALLERRNSFLTRMAAEGFVTEADAKDAILDPLKSCKSVL